MSKHSARLHYPHEKYHLVFQSSINEEEFWGLNNEEKKHLEEIQQTYGCRHCFHVVPDHVKLRLHPFKYQESTDSFEVDEGQLVLVQLNTLEETIVDFEHD